jgi:hypothetical protein
VRRCHPISDNPRAIITEAERRFPLRIAVKVPPGGLGHRYPAMTEWLDDNCGNTRWAMTPAGTRGVLNDAMAVYVSNPTCAVAFVARWLVPGDPPGFYQLREDEPARRVPRPAHGTSP